MNISKLFNFEPVEFSKEISMEDILKGILLAIVFGLIGSIPWVIVSGLGVFASYLGFVIAMAAYKGFVLGAGKMHSVGIVTIVIVVLLAIPFSEMVLLFTEGLKYTTLVSALRLTPIIFFENLGEFMPNILLGYLFAFLGSIRVIKQRPLT